MNEMAPIIERGGGGGGDGKDGGGVGNDGCGGKDGGGKDGGGVKDGGKKGNGGGGGDRETEFGTDLVDQLFGKVWDQCKMREAESIDPSNVVVRWNGYNLRADNTSVVALESEQTVSADSEVFFILFNACIL
jgi:hypothetical protein